MSNPLYEKYNKISEYCKKLEENNYDIYRLFSPIEVKDIENWEKEHDMNLPEGYKNWLLLSNGFDMNIPTILPIEKIRKCPVSEYEDFFVIGYFIGDGSMIVTDKNGNFYELDHVFGLEETTFEDFLENTVMNSLEDGMLEIGAIEKKTQSRYNVDTEEKKRMLERLAEIRKNREKK